MRRLFYEVRGRGSGFFLEPRTSNPGSALKPGGVQKFHFCKKSLRLIFALRNILLHKLVPGSALKPGGVQKFHFCKKPLRLIFALRNILLHKLVQDKHRFRKSDLSVIVHVHICADFFPLPTKNLEKEVIAGRFREDLFYRLNVIEIKVPPLRERKSDLRILTQHFLDKYSKQMGKEVSKISSYAIDLLNKYDFPGNIRELENLIERSVALSTTNILLPDSLAISVHKRTWKKDEEKKEDEKNGGLDAVADGVSLEAVLEKVERT